MVNGVRNVRAEKNIAKKDPLEVYLPSAEALAVNLYPLVQKLANLSSIGLKADEGSMPGFTFLAGKFEFFVPAGAEIDLEAEKAKLEKELSYLQGFIKSVEKKLSNERFVNNAPEAVVNIERTKKADAEAKITALQESLKVLGVQQQT